MAEKQRRKKKVSNGFIPPSRSTLGKGRMILLPDLQLKKKIRKIQRIRL